MRTTNYTDLRANLKGYIDSVIDDCDTVLINRGNGTGVVMISLEEYNQAPIYSLKYPEYPCRKTASLPYQQSPPEYQPRHCCRS